MIEEEIESGAQLVLPASTVSNAPLRFVPGTAPANPNEGDMWYETGGALTALKLRIAGTTRTITIT
jgi:hypothetical protein